MCRGLQEILTCCDPLARNEGISGIAWITSAVGHVIGDQASGKGTTHPRTWVYTVLAHAGQVAGTFCVAHTFWLALNIGVALIVANTLAGRGTIALNAFCVDAARRWVARLDNFHWSGCGYGEKFVTFSTSFK